MIDASHSDIDAQTNKRWLVEVDEAFRSRRIAREAEDLDAQRFAGLGVDLLELAHLVARLPDEPHPLSQIGAHVLGRAGNWIAIWRGKDLGRHLVAQRFQDVELLALRQPGTGQFGALEVAVDPPVLTKEKLPVHLLEIEGEIERASNPRILKLVASRVEGEGPHDSSVALGEFAEDDPLLLDRRNIVRHGPVLGTVLGAPVRMVGLEGFQCERRVTKILVANFVEVIAPDINVQVVGPIVLHPPVNHHTAGHEFLDAVGAIAERRLERGCADVALLARRVTSFPPVLGQYSELSEDHWHFPIAGGTERVKVTSRSPLCSTRTTSR